MSGFDNHAGISLTGTKLQLVEVVYDKNQFVLNNIEEVYFNDPINWEAEKDTKIGALLQSAFNEVIIKKPIKSTSVSFTLPFDIFYLMQIPFDNTLLYRDLIEEFRWEFSILYPTIPVKDLVIQYIEIEKNELYSYNTAIITAIPRKILYILENFCSSNNLRLKFVDNVHIASERGLAVSSFTGEDGLTLSVYLSNKFLSVIYSSKGKPLQFLIIPVNDAADAKQNLKSLLKEKSLAIPNISSIEEAFISGEEISEAMVQTLRRDLNFNFVHFNPFERITPAENLWSNKNYTEKYNSFAAAAGIAYRLA
jgi:Tfp pilus assembly PilM family ATPase